MIRVRTITLIKRYVFQVNSYPCGRISIIQLNLSIRDFFSSTTNDSCNNNNTFDMKVYMIVSHVQL